MIEKVLNFLIEKVFKGSKKEIINGFISIIVVLALLLFVYNTFFNNEIGRNDIDFIENTSKSSNNEDYTVNNDEVRLKKILSQMSGVGEVDVMITYETGKEIIPAFDIQENNKSREERNSDGSIVTDITKDSTKNLVTVNDKDLLVLKEIKPRVKGVIVVAEGAGNLVIRNNIINAVAAVFDLTVDRIEVFEKKISLERGVINE